MSDLQDSEVCAIIEMTFAPFRTRTQITGRGNCVAFSVQRGATEELASYEWPLHDVRRRQKLESRLHAIREHLSTTRNAEFLAWLHH